jgi:transcriptional regulator BetI-like protein
VAATGGPHRGHAGHPAVAPSGPQSQAYQRVPALADAAEDAARRLQEPLAARIAYAVQAGELAPHLDAEHEAARLRLLLEGLRLQFVTTPRRTSTTWALVTLDDHFAAPLPAGDGRRH